MSKPGSLLGRFEAAARGRPALFSATRVLLDVRPEMPADDQPVLRWWSGVDASGGWEAFEYERWGRWQQCCYYGDPGRVNEYTLLASEA